MHHVLLRTEGFDRHRPAESRRLDGSDPGNPNDPCPINLEGDWCPGGGLLRSWEFSASIALAQGFWRHRAPRCTRAQAPRRPDYLSESKREAASGATAAWIGATLGLPSSPSSVRLVRAWARWGRCS